MNTFYRPELIMDYTTRYEPSALETVLNTLILGTVIVACSVILALEGVQVMVA